MISLGSLPTTKTRSSKLLHGIMGARRQSEAAAASHEVQNLLIPQKPAENQPNRVYAKRNRNLSISLAKPSDLHDESPCHEVKESINFEGFKTVKFERRPSIQNRVKPPISRAEKGHSLTNLTHLETSTNTTTGDSSDVIHLPKRVSNSSHGKRPVVTPIRTSDSENMKVVRPYNAARLLERRLSATNSVAQTVKHTFNTSTEKDALEVSSFKNSFTNNANLAQKEEGQFKLRLPTKSFYNIKALQNSNSPLNQPVLNNFLSKPNISAAASLKHVSKLTQPDPPLPTLDDESNFIQLIRSINQTQTFTPQEKPQSMKFNEKTNGASLQITIEPTEPPRMVEDKQVLKEDLEEGPNNLRKERRERMKLQTFPAIEKKRLAYMKSVVPIQEEDESTRRSTVVPSTGTKDRESWKTMLGSERIEEFSDVLERLLDSSRRSKPDT